MSRMSIRLGVLKDEEVLHRSFGQVSEATYCRAHEDEGRAHTLFDPTVFGPSEDWKCACGNLHDPSDERRLCDLCGVALGRAIVLRHRRFGHIKFGMRVPHPLMEGKSLGVFPVIPIAYRTDTGEQDLDYLYSRILTACSHANENQDRGDGCHLSLVRAALAELVQNENAERPVLVSGRVVRSLTHYALSDPRYSMRDLGVFLFAMGLKVIT